MILRLRSHRRYTRTNSRSYYNYYDTKPWWTDEEIMSVLRITKKRFDECLEAHRLSGRPGRQWTPGTARQAFYDFVKREKRWPREADYRNWRETGLPNRRSLAIWCRGEQTLIDTWARSHYINVEMIMSLRNLTTRRDAMNRYGIDKIIKNGGAKEVQQDDFGKLWRFDMRDGADGSIVYVEVVNKTPQLDSKGKVVKNKNGDPVFDHYFLRVPPTTRTAKDAVAWVSNIPENVFAGFAAES